MLTLHITALTAGLLALIYVYLSLRVIKQRALQGPAVGEGTDDVFIRVQRAHANFAEYVPLALIVCGLLEFHGLRVEVLYMFAVALVLGRILHARGMFQKNMAARTWGMQLTLWPILLGGAALVYMWFVQTFLF